jgi:hypothetical protein
MRGLNIEGKSKFALAPMLKPGGIAGGASG